MLNTLSLAVWDADKRRGQHIKECLEMLSEKEAAFYLGEYDGEPRHDVFFLSFGEYGAPVLRTARTVRCLGEDIFLMLISRRSADLLPLLRPAIRPSGVLFHPVENTRLRDTLFEISSEMKRIAERGDTAAFMLKSDGVSYRIPYKDILFFEASNKKVTLHMPGQQIGYYDSIDNLASTLTERFIRCHRSYIVNADKIEQLLSAKMEVRLTGGYRVPVSRSYKDTVKKAVKS